MEVSNVDIYLIYSEFGGVSGRKINAFCKWSPELVVAHSFWTLLDLNVR